MWTLCVDLEKMGAETEGEGEETLESILDPKDWDVHQSSSCGGK